MSRSQRSPWRIYGGKGVLGPWIRSYLRPDGIGTWIEPYQGGMHMTCALPWDQMTDTYLLTSEVDPNLWCLHNGDMYAPVIPAIMEASHRILIMAREGDWQGIEAMYHDTRDRVIGRIKDHVDPESLDRSEVAADMWVMCRLAWGGYQILKRSGWTGEQHTVRFVREGISALGWWSFVSSRITHADHSERQLFGFVRDILADKIDGHKKRPVVYLDPPYMHDSRGSGTGAYASELGGAMMTADILAEMLERWLSLDATVILSHHTDRGEAVSVVRDVAHGVGRSYHILERRNRQNNRSILRTEGLWIFESTGLESVLDIDRVREEAV